MALLAYSRFTKRVYDGRVEENVAPGRFVVAVSAVDPDGDPYGIVSFRLLNQEKHNTFSIDDQGKNGLVSMHRQLRFSKR